MRRLLLQILLSAVACLTLTGAATAEVVSSHPGCCEMTPEKPRVEALQQPMPDCCPPAHEPCECNLQAPPTAPADRTAPLTSTFSLELVRLFQETAPSGSPTLRPGPSFPTTPPPSVRPSLQLLTRLYPNPPPHL